MIKNEDFRKNLYHIQILRLIDKKTPYIENAEF